MLWRFFYYYSLPDMPEDCHLFPHDIMYRDFFECNKPNPGHHKYPKFENLSYDVGCHKREVRKLLRKNDPEKYVIFYTRHTQLSGAKQNKVVGYFKVGDQFTEPRIGFMASESVLLPKSKSFPIAYSGRGVPASWGNSKFKDRIDEILKELQSLKNKDIDITKLYQEETKKIMDMLNSQSGINELIETCNKCPFKKKCKFWGRKSEQDRRKKIGELYSRKENC